MVWFDSDWTSNANGYLTWTEKKPESSIFAEGCWIKARYSALSSPIWCGRETQGWVRFWQKQSMRIYPLISKESPLPNWTFSMLLRKVSVKSMFLIAEKSTLVNCTKTKTKRKYPRQTPLPSSSSPLYPTPLPARPSPQQSRIGPDILISTEQSKRN